MNQTAQQKREPNYRRQLIRSEVIERMAENDSRRRTDGREDCAICRSYKPITELHHILSVSDIVKLYEIADKVGGLQARTALGLAYATVWLCPTHHTLLHLAYSKRRSAGADVQECIKHYPAAMRQRFQDIITSRETLLRENRQRLNQLFDEFQFTDFRFIGDSL